jgi:hypothetical protein
MLCARVTLTAGPHHKRYKAGAAVRAVVFAKGYEHPDELEGESFKPLAARGWKRMTIDGHKLLSDDFEFPAADSAEAEAFRTALEKGFGIVVLGLVQ